MVISYSFFRSTSNLSLTTVSSGLQSIGLTGILTNGSSRRPPIGSPSVISLRSRTFSAKSNATIYPANDFPTSFLVSSSISSVAHLSGLSLSLLFLQSGSSSVRKRSLKPSSVVAFSTVALIAARKLSCFDLSLSLSFISLILPCKEAVKSVLATTRPLISTLNPASLR